MPAYCEVALPVPLDHTFTYGVCAGQRPQRGARVIVPFRNEKLIGVVTALDAKAPAEVEVRYLEAVLDEEPLLSEHLLELAEWTAQYYLAPLGEVLRAMLPLMAEVRRTVHYRLTDLGRDILAGEHRRRPGEGNRQAALSPPAQGLFRKSRHGASGAFAAGFGRAGEGVHAAHGYGGLAAAAGRHGAQEVDCPGDRGCGARRAAHGALCRVGSGDAPAQADREAADDSGRVGGLRGGDAAGRVATARSTFVYASDISSPRAGAHR